MKILHYSLGIPPIRRGGLVNYALDLAINQSQMDNDVILIYPGYNHISKPFSNYKLNTVSIINNLKILSFSDPTPIPIFSGVSDPENFKKNESNFKWEDFWQLFKPDIIHIHTLLGINNNFFSFFKSKSVPLVFTTHDYYGICLKINLFKPDSRVCNTPFAYKECCKCNINADTTHKSKMRNTYIFHLLNQSRKKYLKNYGVTSHPKNISNTNNPSQKIEAENFDSYKMLLENFGQMIDKIDFFHFNSQLTKDIYKSCGFDINGEIIPITHSKILDKRQKREIDEKKNIRLGYIGSNTRHKGLPILIEILSKLKTENVSNWSLSIYGTDQIIPTEKEFIFKGKFSLNELKDIFNNIDLLIIPSFWKETFGFTGLEALSFGVPILVTSNVGMSFLVKKYNVGIVAETKEESIENAIRKILTTPYQLEKLNENILKIPKELFSFKNHTEKILKLYNDIACKKY